MTIIEKIKAEIERQIKDPQEHCYGVSSVNKLRELLDFIGSLESEKPIIQDDLEKEIQKYLESKGVGYGGWIDGWEDEDLREIARHFAQWGAEHAREEMNQEAVEGVVSVDVGITGREYFNFHSYDFNPIDKFKDGDKVRVIVIPNTDEK